MSEIRITKDGPYRVSGDLPLTKVTIGANENGESGLGQRHEPCNRAELPPSIGAIEDPAESCSGPLWVRGGVQVVAADGHAYEVRNRVTLCRCGTSKNKPFCDSSHATIKFRDGL